MSFFKINNTNPVLLILLLFFFNTNAQEVTVRGSIVGADSSTAIPFVYVINTNTGHGQMSDGNGKFFINANICDSIIFSFIGYKRLKIPVKKLFNGEGSQCKIIMNETTYNLNQVVVSDFKLKPYENEYMKRVISGSKISTINAIQSPITALYMQFSQKGKEQRKLAKIFEDIFIQEEVGKKFNGETLRKLTGDENIDFEKFRKYCYYLSNDFIINNEGYDLYYRVMDCYYRWKEEGKGK
jgi:hypothetical protein